MRSFNQKIVMAAMVLTAFAHFAAAQANVAEFDLFPNPKFVACLGAPGGPNPKAHVTVRRGTSNDTLTIEGNNLKPHLAFDLFTVQHSPLKSDGTPDPAFTGSFGMAWYQSDLQANAQGHFKTTIKTILLDQIFGFDADTALAPTNTFHVGFWFNNPNDANVNGCVFNVANPTPFNGEHKAGPVAMISVPDVHTNLGPLCTNPNHSNNTCNP
jgi:hypothetical protein